MAYFAASRNTLFEKATMDKIIVEEFFSAGISAADDAQCGEIGRLIYTPEVMAPFLPFPKSAPTPRIDWPKEKSARLFVVRHEGRIVAVSGMEARRIQTPQGLLDVLALGGVKTHPGFRFRGFGAAVVRAAFAYVDNGVFRASLFQTGVPGFYEKLGFKLRPDDEHGSGMSI